MEAWELEPSREYIFDGIVRLAKQEFGASNAGGCGSVVSTTERTTKSDIRRVGKAATLELSEYMISVTRWGSSVCTRATSLPGPVVQFAFELFV